MEPEGAAVGVPSMEGTACPRADAIEAAVASAPVELGVSFAEFYAGSRDRIARALSLTLGDVHLGADAADEAMARAYPRWRRVGTFDDPAGWVYRVGLNWASSVLRRRRRAPSPASGAGPADIGPIAEPSVMAALGALSIDHRAVIVCRFYLGLSEAETAAALKTRPGTVKSRLSRGLQALRGPLAHLDPQEHR